jgi:hypothetical protein
MSARNAWQRIIETADAHNDPGRFTALIGWEWSSNPGGANLHRIVMSDADAEQAAAQFPAVLLHRQPLSGGLWAWLAETSEAVGARFVAIPHNSNISKGFMFDDPQSAR